MRAKNQRCYNPHRLIITFTFWPKYFTSTLFLLSVHHPPYLLKQTGADDGDRLMLCIQMLNDKHLFYTVHRTNVSANYRMFSNLYTICTPLQKTHSIRLYSATIMYPMPHGDIMANISPPICHNTRLNTVG